MYSQYDSCLKSQHFSYIICKFLKNQLGCSQGAYTMKGYKASIESMTKNNTHFRHVLYTGKHTQLVLMSLLPSEEIGMEVHPDNDQFFRFEEGVGKVIIDGNEYNIKDGDAVIIPAGSQHNVINTSDSLPLKMYTLYSPPHHKDGVLRKTKQEAIEHELEFDGGTTE